MKNFYFLEKLDRHLLKEQVLPLTPKKSEWVKVSLNGSNFLSREFVFENYEQMMFFVQKSMKYSHKINHLPKFVISDESVTVTTNTENLNDITEQDIRLTKTLNQLFNDSTSIFKQQDAASADNVNNDERHVEGYHFDWTNRW